MANFKTMVEMDFKGRAQNYARRNKLRKFLLYESELKSFGHNNYLINENYMKCHVRQLKTNNINN